MRIRRLIPVPPKRFAAEELRELLSDLAGYVVGRLSFRRGRLIIWLHVEGQSEPALAVKLIGLRASRDNGLCGAQLYRAEVSDRGLLQIDPTSTQPEEDAAGWHLDFWSTSDRRTPIFQALARKIRVFGGPGLSPDRVWSN